MDFQGKRDQPFFTIAIVPANQHRPATGLRRNENHNIRCNICAADKTYLKLVIK